MSSSKSVFVIAATWILFATLFIAAPLLYGAPQLTNPDASPEARAVYAYLCSLMGKNMLTGQHTYTCDDTWYNKARSITGKYPAVWGRDFAGYDGCGSPDEQRRRLANAAIDRWNEGTIITIMWHATPPGVKPDWGAVKGGANMDAIITEGSSEYQKLLKDYDAIAGYLKQLQDKNIPVLWRPYHEINGGWFWWGNKGSKVIKLWKIMYDYFTNHHKLNNLLWNWNVNEKNQWCGSFESHFPGIDYVDILTVDVYGSYKSSDYTALKELAQGKPLAFGEVGPYPDPNQVKSSMPDYTYFLTWGKCIHCGMGDCHNGGCYNSVATVKSVYSNNYVITQDELPDLDAVAVSPRSYISAPGSVLTHERERIAAVYRLDGSRVDIRALTGTHWHTIERSLKPGTYFIQSVRGGIQVQKIVPARTVR
jgi:mannan endo-1,4-beta-mannosidase